ncbi:type I-E CRISPR-associated protein Cse1/CasA [Streptomyces sp. IB2014 016-6]|uniref:type I-E CRISPR-associated protein Cse1/CasA n=1 Tax=Streptomyces sp. IB2014 016-6 TaxID=2517818 RepID=UPI00164EE8B4|nr:type I-E CRISPR-associated protein Cse1/CasA [Streptomyces sp. IB2014 016-6]
MPPPPHPPSFSAADDPWIEVRTGHRYHRVGLRELLLDAHTFDDLAVPHPPAAAGLLRIAVALTARVTALDDPDLNASRWNQLRRDHFAAGRFDADRINAYFDSDQNCWDVFDPLRPWMQDPALREECESTAGINALVPGRPSGNNLAWFAPHASHTQAPVATGRALQHLLIHHFYGRFGTCTPRTPSSGKASKNLRGGPLRTSVSFHPMGRTLHETLLAGLPLFRGDEQLLPDRCPWEEPQPPDPLAAPHPVTWPGRLLTGRSVHALLLLPGDDSTTVRDTYFTWATRHPSPEATDPYLAYHLDFSKEVAHRRTVRRADADRAWWRELDTLALAPDEEGPTRRPAIFDTLNDLPPPLRRTLRVRVIGFEQNTTKAIDHQWYTALTPPLLHWAHEHDPARAQRIADCCRAAELAAEQLAIHTNDAWRTATAPRGTNPSQTKKKPSTGKTKKPSTGKARKNCVWARQALHRYWPLAEQLFWQMLEEPDTSPHTAFAQAAVTALRQSTTHARARDRAAARALAEAVAGIIRRTADPAPPHTRSI